MTGSKKDKRLRGAAGREERQVNCSHLVLRQSVASLLVPALIVGSVQGVKHPRKALYRARAHANPLSDSQWPVPACPSEYDW